MSEEKKQLKFFSYCRASTEDQKITLKDQEDKIKNYCGYKGHKIIECYIDGGVSGSINAKERPEMKKLLERLQKGEGDGIIVTKIDRLSRNSNDFISMLDYFNNNNIQLIILDPEIDTKSIFGKLMCTIMSALAQMELDLIRQRTKDALKKLKETGKVYGQIPYGKKKDDNGNLIDNANEINNINLIIRYYTVEKLSTQKIAEKLSNDGVERAPNNTKWYPTQINRILKANNIFKEKKSLRNKI